jgi:hypothetical protein
MTLNTILITAVILSIIFHFIGVYANAKKTVWLMIVLMWAAAFSIANGEVKPKAYDDIKKMQGKYADTDKLIKDAMPDVTLYEMILIKKSFIENEPKE